MARHAGRGKFALWVLTVMAAAALTACASEPVDDDPGKLVDMPLDWDDIDLAEADLTLPLVTPLEINTLGKRVGEGQVFENLYTFQGLRGYLLTSRIAFGHYTNRVSDELRTGRVFYDYAEELSLPPGGKMKVESIHRFENGDPRTKGFYTRAAAEPYHSSCFIARIGYLMVDYASIERTPESVDTIVEVLLCGKLPSDEVMLAFLGKLKAVENRAEFRQRLSKSTIGTI